MTLTPLRFGRLALVSVLLGSGTPLAAQTPPTTPPETPPTTAPATPPASALRLSGVVLDARAGTPIELADVEAVSPSATARGSLRTRERVETMLPRLPMFGVTWRF